MDTSVIPKVITLFIPFLFALCAHEFAHGWVANKLGDPTAKLMGRLTLNPIPHADPVGTVVLPLLGMFTGLPVIGWAKPVPVNSRNLRNQKMGMFWVASAGPGSNLIMAFIGAFTFVFAVKTYGPTGFLFEISRNFIMINLWLAIFNLIPLAPLDGAKIFDIFLPQNVSRKLDEMQMYSGILMLVLFFTGILPRIIAFVAEPIYHAMINTAAFALGVS